MIPTSLVVWIYLAFALLVVVVGVGLARHDTSLNLTAVATTLITGMCGVATGAAFRAAAKRKDESDGS